MKSKYNHCQCGKKTFKNGLVILSDFDGFPGLAHLAVDKINVISLENTSTV
ncbi:hypothetical protein [Bacillus cereus]|uniref:hypothetical protein n=1 Tax=Bacillus cereus TaxID=1396 RepID=UPI0015967E57|nr:hypothetical protein [Bacillus cereus]